MEAIGAIRSSEVKAAEAIASANRLDPASRGHTPKEDANPPEESGSDLAQIEKTSRDKIEHIAQLMDDYVRSTQRSLRIQVHQGTGNIMVKVISKEDGRTIREVPPEELLNLAATMEKMMGLLINEKV